VLAQLVHGCAQLLSRYNPFGPAPQQAANALRRIGKDCLEPAIKCFVSKGLRLVFGNKLEEWVDPGLDWALVKKVPAKGVNRADARELEFLEGAIKSSALFRPSISTGCLDSTAKMELGLPGRFLSEGDGDDALERANAGADESYNAPDESSRLSGSGRCLDKEGCSELFGNAAARFAICKFRHSAPRSATKGANRALGLRLMRRSSWGPHTPR
jgi:hypothetical protein